MLAYLQNLAVLICVNAILAMTLNFLMGYAGIFSLAHAVFFGVGAYAAALVSMHVSSSIFVCTIASMALCGALSLALALPALRVRGEYFVAASLGLQMLAVTVFSEWRSVTGGLGGITNIPSPVVFGVPVETSNGFFLLALGYLIAVALVLWLLVRSSFGRNLQAIRDSESAAQALGKNVKAIKTLSVVAAAALAGTAGVVYTFYLSFINVEGFTLDLSVLLMAMVIIGGTGSLFGPLIGAALLVLLPAALSFVPGLPQAEVGLVQQAVYGLVMVLLMIYRPGGIVGAGKRRRNAVAQAQQAAQTSAQLGEGGAR
ncbi:branched-chain amino acid ABC transporter permease [Paraburkholderia lycopersici]|uniref:Branched-chain amino acid transport system permease protein n=1 Tax=Paraburkholderia lycopersici TaxID=416944 RepID=A0A1G7AP66_9BURK|nr:branched-chain amino acid ABC transporter permease [Paraburkholderia lycopersici]SDE16668.1 branched-chain amino acid transport system permease protein [Paraburkholderia lycopersici]